MALTAAQRAQMDEVLRKTTGTTSTLTPDIRAKMDAIVQQQEAKRLNTTQTPAQQAGHPGPVQSFVQGIAHAPLSFATGGLNAAEGFGDLAASGVQSLLGNKQQAQQLANKAGQAATKERDFGYLGKARPTVVNDQGKVMTGPGVTGRIVGQGLELGSYVAPGAEAFGLGKEGLLQGGKELLGQGLKQTAIATGKAGALQGGVSGLGSAIQNPTSVGQVLGQTAEGAGLGLVGGAALGATGYGLSRALPKVSELLRPGGITAHRIDNAVEHNVNALTDLEKNNRPLQRIVAKAQSQGFDVKRDIAKNIPLGDIVDSNGAISTRGAGEALSQIDDFLSKGENGQGGPETAVRAILEREGKSVNLIQVRNELIDNIDKSGLEGAALDNAHAKISAEIRGLARRADAEGNISLSKLQDAKISKSKTVNYLDEGAKIADKDIASTYRKLIETHTTSADVKALNRELARIYTMRDFLESLHGRKVKGGKLGKYFAKIGGQIVGGHIGGPIGSFVGGEVAGRIQGLLMKGAFKDVAGEGLQASQLMKDALKLGATPKEVPKQNLGRLALPAPAIVPPLPPDTSGLLSQEAARAQLKARGWQGLEPKEAPKPQTTAVKSLMSKLQSQARKQLISSDEGFNRKLYTDSLAEQAVQDKAALTGSNNRWKDVMKAIHNSPEFKKEGSITDALRGGSILERNGRKVVIPANKVKEYLARGYTVSDTLDGVSHAAGFESAEDYLTFITELSNEDKAVDRSPVLMRSHKYLLKNDPEYARREKWLEQFRQKRTGGK